MTAQSRQRLDKVLSHMGKGSRKEIKQLVKAGRVLVNGDAARDSGVYVVPGQDTIYIDGVPLVYREYIYLMMNKPAGLVSATEDRVEGVVTELLDDEHRVFEPFPVGRLDKDTEGFLLLTNDGQFSHRLLSPKRHIPKTYYARIDGEVSEVDVTAFATGVTLADGYRTLPGELRILNAGDTSEIEVTIYEGKYHQVKRMFEAVGKRVVYLKRIAMGPLALDQNLALGEYRELTDEEVGLLQMHGGV